MLLGVNIDHVATLRNARGGTDPSVIDAALICQNNNVNGITIHLREDRRHIKDKDLHELSQIKDLRINLEMAATNEMQKIALMYKPAACCIVPEKRQEITTEGGLDVASQIDKMSDFVKPLLDAGILVSLFIDAKEKQIRAAAEIGAPFIELHTGVFANAWNTDNQNIALDKLKEAAILAHSLGLKVNAGHGLNYENVSMMHKIPNLEELNIGHSIISRAVFVGLDTAVKQMLQLIA